MRKFNFLSFLIGVIAVGGVGAFALTSQYLKSDGTPDFQKLKSTANSNQLNAEMRDQLMDGLSKMQAQLPSTHGETIPAGAVMAFNLSSCPDGWSPFTEANDRFIMGSQGNLREKGGNKEIMMQANQLAPHSHWFVDTIYSEANVYWGGGNRFRAGVDLQSGRWRIWQNSDTDYDNRLHVVRRKTGSEISNGEENTKSRTAGDITAWSKAYDRQSWMPDNDVVGKQQPLKILNPYIKLLYCVKGENIAPTPTPRPAPSPKRINGICSSNIGECKVGAPTSTKTTDHYGLSISNRYKISSSVTTRTCKGENGGRDAACSHCKNWNATDGFKCDAGNSLLQ